MKRGKKLRRRGGFVKKKKGEKRIRKTVVKRRINTGKGRRPKKSDGYEKKRKERIVTGRMAGKRRPRKKERLQLSWLVGLMRRKVSHQYASSGARCCCSWGLLCV